MFRISYTHPYIKVWYIIVIWYIAYSTIAIILIAIYKGVI